MADNPLPGGKYEFAKHHEDDFSHLARYMQIAATFMLVLGGLTAVGGVMILAGSALSGSSSGKWFNGIRGMVSGGVWITMGGMLYQSSLVSGSSLTVRAETSNT